MPRNSKWRVYTAETGGGCGTWRVKVPQTDGPDYVVGGTWQVVTAGRSRGQVRVDVCEPVTGAVVEAVRRYVKQTWDKDHPGTRVDGKRRFHT